MKNVIYKQLEASEIVGCSIEAVVEKLQFLERCGTPTCADFNGHLLYSDTVTIDSAYLEITGMTKEQRDQAYKRELDELQKKLHDFQFEIPQLAKEYMEQGRAVLDEAYWETWDRVVVFRLHDIYHGKELGACLEVVKALSENEEQAFETAHEILESQHHSGHSSRLVLSMVITLCDKGKAFADYLEAINEKSSDNPELASEEVDFER